MILQQIIEDMEQQIEAIKELEFVKPAQITIDITFEDAQRIVKVLKGSLDIPPMPSLLPSTGATTANATPTYEWTLADEELPATKGSVVATQQYLDDRLAEMEEKIIYFIKNPRS